MDRTQRSAPLNYSNKMSSETAAAYLSASHWRFDDVLSQLLRSYEGRPIEVDFRTLVPVGSGSDRATHLMHSYPAKLLPNIPIFFLNCNSLAPLGGTIYDPFCGTGTVLVEGLLAGKRIVGADANPLARLIASAKTTKMDREHCTEIITSITNRARKAPATQFQAVVNVDKWFDPDTQHQLGKIRTAIDEVAEEDSRQFAQVVLSQTIKKVSLADPRMSVPVRYRGEARELPDGIETFRRIGAANAIRVAALPADSRPHHIGDDARKPLTAAPPAIQADLIITSPPYAGAQKYVRASSLSLGWLGMVPEGRLRTLETLNIGREHLTHAERSKLPAECSDLGAATLRKIAAINPLRADIVRVYLSEMREAASAIVASLARGGHLVLVMGDNQVCGIPFRTSQIVRELFETEGLTLLCELVDTIKSRGLMTKRNKTAGMIAREHVFLFRR